MSVCNFVIKINGLTGVLLHETFINKRAILWGDEEAGPTYPSERHGLLASRESGYETT